VVDDLSGEHARDWLAGRPQGKAERLAQRYGRDAELRVLSVLAHADTRALNLVATPPGWIGTHPDDGFFNVRPGRDPRRSELTLYLVAYELASLSAVLAALFEVTVHLPRWLSDELVAAGKRIRGGNDDAGEHTSHPRRHTPHRTNC